VPHLIAPVSPCIDVYGRSLYGVPHLDPPPVGFGLDTFQSALVFVPAGLVILIAGPIFGRIGRIQGAKNALPLASLIVVASFIWFFLFNATPAEIVVGTVILFAGIGGVFVCAINVLIMYVPPSKTGAERQLIRYSVYRGRSWHRRCRSTAYPV